MIETVQLKDIKPNPFNSRTEYDQKSIDELAKEIGKIGFWNVALRGRKNNGKIELSFGHRRLTALKKAGYDKVEVDVVDLTDEQMATESLIENLQRQGLNDMEKAEGIKRLVELKSKNGSSKEAYESVRTLLGYDSTEWIKDLTGITEYAAPIKKLISERKISATTAIRAHFLGGDKMVETAAKEGLPFHTIVKISKTLKEIPDDKVREKLKAKVIAGEITDPKEIKKRAEPMLQAKAEKGKPPPDLRIVIMRWTDSIAEWRKALREVIPFRDYLDTSPGIAKKFREEVRGLIPELEKVCITAETKTTWTLKAALKRLENAVQDEINGFNETEGELEDLQAVGNWLLKRGTELTTVRIEHRAADVKEG